MSNNFFNVGNALESLENAKNAAAEQEFQTKIEDIQNTANEKTTLFGDIEKGSGTLLGGIAGTKAVISGIKKIKSKISELRKGKKTDEGDEAEAEEPAETAETTETDAITDLSDLTPDFSSLTQSVRNAAQNVQDTLSNGMEGLQNTGRNLISDIQNGVNPSEAGRAPQEIEMTELPEDPTDALSTTADAGETPEDFNDGSITRGAASEELEAEDEVEPLGRNLFNVNAGRDTGNASGNLFERQPDATREGPEADTEEAPGTVQEDFPALPDADETGEAGIAADDPAAEFGGTQAEGIADITTDTSFGVPATAAETGVEVGAEVGAEEGIGAALDSTGILAPLGIALQIFGLVSAGAGVAAGIIGSDEAQQQETKDTQAAQAAEAAQIAAPADVAGRVAPNIQTQLQRSVGGY